MAIVTLVCYPVNLFGVASVVLLCEPPRPYYYVPFALPLRLLAPRKIFVGDGEFGSAEEYAYFRALASLVLQLSSLRVEGLSFPLSDRAPVGYALHPVAIVPLVV